jgi:hypothetical protein
MLNFQDFIPLVQKTLLGFPTDYESIDAVMTRVRRWIERERIQVLNVETLFLPILPNEHEESAPARIAGFANAMSVFQVIRVWHQDPPAPERGYTGITSRLDPRDS